MNDTYPIGKIGLVNNIRTLLCTIPVAGPENINRMMLVFQGLDMLSQELSEEQKEGEEDVCDRPE